MITETDTSANNRIRALFSRKRNNILSVYYTAGFPDRESTIPVALALEQGGADLIEIGIPFSDPVADGPTIQESNRVALNGGMNVRLLLEQVAEIRKQCAIPVVLMGYLNPVMQYGIEAFINDASGAGADGVIIPDLPLYEFEHSYRAAFRRANVSNTFLVAPTTGDERIRRIDALSDGFIYAVSASSTTGAKNTFTEEQIAYFKRLRDMEMKNPFLIGFGIADRAAFQTACRYGSGAIVGSAFIRHLAKGGAGTAAVEKFIKTFIG